MNGKIIWVCFFVLLVNMGPAAGQVRLANLVLHNQISHGLYDKYPGNIPGMAYLEGKNQVMLSAGSHCPSSYPVDSKKHSSYLVQLDLVTEEPNIIMDFQEIFDPNWFAGSLAYLPEREELYILAYKKVSPDPIRYETHLIRMTLTGEIIDRRNLADIEEALPRAVDGIFVDTEGIWLTSFTDDLLIKLSFVMLFKEQHKLSEFAEGFCGPVDITSSLNEDRFWVLDHFDSRTVEMEFAQLKLSRYIDSNDKRYTSEMVEEEEWDGRGLAITVDKKGQRLFINDDNILYIFKM